MLLTAILEKARGQGIALWADGERLGVKAQSGPIPSDVRELLAAHKPALLDLLSAEEKALAALVEMTGRQQLAFEANRAQWDRETSEKNCAKLDANLEAVAAGLLRLNKTLSAFGWNELPDGRWHRIGTEPPPAWPYAEDPAALVAEALAELGEANPSPEAVGASESPENGSRVDSVPVVLTEETPQTWDAETAGLIAWLEVWAPPAAPFKLRAGWTITDPAQFRESLRRDVLSGPDGPRARGSALQNDLRALWELFGEGQEQPR